MHSPATVLKVLAASVKIAERAGAIIRKINSLGELDIKQKESINDLQTEADRSSQRYIVSSLLSLFPNLDVIGEEDDVNPVDAVGLDDIALDEEVLEQKCPHQFLEVTESELVVWVDPLDGTKEFTQGLLDHVTVLIGLSWQGKSIGGVIHQPYFNYQNKGAELGRTMWGLVGLGVHGCESNSPPEGAVVTTAKMHKCELIDESIKACEPTKVVKVGGAGYKVVLLLEGKAHAYVFPHKGCKKWDTCAPEGLLRARGGQLTDMFGNEFEYHKEVQRTNVAGVLATLSSDHSWYLNKVPAKVKDALQQSI